MERTVGTLTGNAGISGNLSVQSGVSGNVVTDAEHIVGTLTGVSGISGSLSAQGGVSGNVVIPSQIPVEEYDGDYTVTPRLDEQTLATRGYKMRDNVTVEMIPVVTTSNPYGGKTVVIG